MKKFIIVFFIFSVFYASCTYANDAMIFDNVTFGKTYKIKGYASVILLGFKFVNMYAQWEDGKASPIKKGGDLYDNSDAIFAEKQRAGKVWLDSYSNCFLKTSGNEAEFAWLKIDIVNLQKLEANFIKDITIKVIYDDEYEYDGWVRQFNYDYSKSEIYRYKETTLIGWPVCLSPVDEMPIKPMYKGHYVLGCTLPNFVVEDKNSPLRMIINIGDNKLTYNIR